MPPLDVFPKGSINELIDIHDQVQINFNLFPENFKSKYKTIKNNFKLRTYFILSSFLGLIFYRYQFLLLL